MKDAGATRVGTDGTGKYGSASAPGLAAPPRPPDSAARMRDACGISNLLIDGAA